MNHKRLIKGFLILAPLVLGLALILGGSATAGPHFNGGAPGVIAYQGYLADRAAQPINGTFNVTFALYAHPSGGEPLWEENQQAVQVANGNFSVLLGSHTRLSPAHFNDRQRYLEVRVEYRGSILALPRQQLASVPFALNAEVAASAPWDGLIGMPPGFGDGNDADTTYTAGTGLALNGTEFSVEGSAYANVLVVAKSGGDFVSVQAAIDSITEASRTNPYLVWVAPGVYSETVTMKPYVHLKGAGQDATVLASTATDDILPPGAATLVLTHSVSLRDLTVDNTGTGNYNVALLAGVGVSRTLIADVTARAQGNGIRNYGVLLNGNATQCVLQDVTALAVNGNFQNFGLFNSAGANTTLRGGTFSGHGGNDTRGIYNSSPGTNLQAQDIVALAEGMSSLMLGSTRLNPAPASRESEQTPVEGTIAPYNDSDGTASTGIYNDFGASANLIGSTITGRGGTAARGIVNVGSDAALEADRVTFAGENGSIQNYGLLNEFDARAEFTNSLVEGATNAIRLSSGNVLVGNSRLVGGPVFGMVNCVAVSRGSNFNASGCP